MAAIIPSEAQLLYDIGAATDHNQIGELMGRVMTYYRDNAQLLTALLNKQSQLLNEANRNFNNARRQIGTITGPDGSPLTDYDFHARLQQRIPPNTYTQVKVTTLANYLFTQTSKKARKIELIRAEWGFWNVPLFFEGIGAFFSSLGIQDSPYRQIVCEDTLMKGLLASSIIETNPEKKADFEKQLVSAYWQGKSIEIIVPTDFSENGVVSMGSASGYLNFQIHSGRWFRSLFTNQ